MKLFPILKQTGQQFLEDDCPQMAAALSYYTVFSLPPLLIIVISVAGLFFDPENVRGEIQEHLVELFGKSGAEQVEETVRHSDEQQGGVLRSIVGAIALLIGATGVVTQLQIALNKTWNVEPDPNQGGVRHFLFKRMISLAMVMSVAFLLMVSLVINAILAAFGRQVESWLPGGVSATMLAAANSTVSFLIIFVVFTAMYRFLPDATIRWRDVTLGALVTTVLFVIGKFALSLYLGNSDIGSTYGAAGSLAVILVWIYYAGMIFFIGAEFTQVWNKHAGRRPKPEPGATRVETTVTRFDATPLSRWLAEDSAATHPGVAR